MGRRTPLYLRQPGNGEPHQYPRRNLPMSLEAITKALEAMEANLAECQGGRVGDAGDLVAALYRCADVDAPAVVAALRVAARIIAFVGERSEERRVGKECR